MIEQDNFITFNEQGHTYTDKEGYKYVSVSDLVGMVEPDFPAHVIAKAVAKKEKVNTETVLQRWEDAKQEAINIGNEIHRALKEYRTGEVKNRYWLPMLMEVNKIFNKYDSTDSEKMVYSKRHLVAGTADIICYRNRKIADIYDFKTNERRGIQFQDKYNKYLKSPLEWLENCNYNIYCLKLSLYGRLMELSLGYRVGKLGLIYISPFNAVEYETYPVPYMRAEVDILLEHHARENITRRPEYIPKGDDLWEE